METHVGEVILGKHRVGRICAVIIVKDDVLFVLAALNDLRRASLEFVTDLLDQGDDERSHDGEDKDRKLLLELFDELGQNRNLLNRLGNIHENLVVQLDGRHYLLEDLLNVTSVLFGVARGHIHVLHLGIVGVGLDLLELLLLIVAAKETAGNLVEQVLKETGIVTAAVLESAFQLVDLVLGELVRDCGQLDIKALEEISDGGCR